jgi:RNA polymerase sigma factor for flagellar operon FliA
MEDWQKQLVSDHEYLVKHIANIVVRDTGYKKDRQDLHQEGHLGLMEAASHFDPTRGVLFKTFAWPRISGAMRTYLQKDHVIRVPPIRPDPEVREILDVLAAAQAEIRQSQRTEPTAGQLAAALDYPVDEIAKLLPKLAQRAARQDARRITLVDVQERPLVAEDPTPEDMALRHEQEELKRKLIEDLHTCIRALPFERMATLILCDLGKIAAPQAARILERTPADMQRLRRQARKQVRACLIQKGWAVQDVAGLDGLRGADIDENC